MAATKMRNWDTALDGPIPLISEYAQRFQPVRITDTDGESFGWERPDGRLIKGVVVTPSETEQAARDAAQATAVAALNGLKAKQDLRATLKAKRQSGQPLTPGERDALADLVLGV